MQMKVSEFIKKDIDIDVWDNVCDELGVAFCGPMELTEKGKERFKEILECDIDVNERSCCAVIDVDGDDWEHRLEEAKLFFWGIAGYIDDKTWNEWFIIPEDER